jgi:uncharacterized membrane protein YccC
MDRLRFAHLTDLFVASDPSLDRLRSGLRAVLTAGIAAGVFLLITRWAGLDYKLALAGIVVPMISVVAVQDPGRRAQQVTLAWVPVLASATLIIGTFVADHPWLSGALFLATIFAAFQARRLGPRGAGLGTIAYQSFFYAMLFKTPLDKVAWTPLFVFTGCAIAWAVHFWLVPEHPGRMLRSELRAYRARTAALLHDLARWLEHATPAGAGRIDAHLAALNGQSLALDARLAGFAAGPGDAAAVDLRDRILRSELALETIAAVARDAAAETRPLLADAVRTLRDGVRSQQPFAAPAVPAIALPDTPGWRLSRALHAVAALQPWRQPLPAMRDEHQAPPPAGKPTAAKGHPWLDDTSRRALQACASAAAAILAGHAISPSHWYWSVFAAFVVFTRAATVGQTLSGAWRQVLASVAGLCLGVVVAELAHGSRTTELVLLFVFVALGFYAFRGLQNLYTVLLTAMLAMVYELMGMNSPGLLLLRLGETVAGAISAVLAARLVLPVHTTDEADDRSADLLRAAGGLLGAALHGAPRPPYGALREADRKLQALRQSLGPVTGAAYPGSKEDRRRHLDRLSRVAYCARHLTMLGHAEAFRAAIGIVRQKLDGVATMLEAPGRPAQPVAGLPRLPALDAAALLAGADAPDEATRAAAQLLAETDALLRALQAELTAPSKH